MAIGFTTPRPTHSLIHASRPTFYPTKIPVQHPQLKNYISSEHHGVIYYASEHEVYALHLSTRKRELIKSLSWKPRCMDAGHGWVCMGGESNGQCAFISIDQARCGGLNPLQNAEVDGVLPLDLDPDSRALTHPHVPLTRSHMSSPPKYDLQDHELGGSIVNSVTIYLLPSDQEGSDEVVAVMTNNDYTVRIFSLTLSRLVATISYPTLMNHASISPSGDLLLAVGDAPQAFFHRRVPTPIVAIRGQKNIASHQWEKVADPQISLALIADPKDCCFSTAFSPSGHVCAVATQGGVTTIFSTSLIHADLDADEAVICVLRSSRTRDSAGAVRSMSFSPSPWDLLAYAEDQGRVCVVNLRNSFGSTQILELDATSPNVKRVVVEDQQSTLEQRQLEIERRFINSHRGTLDAQDTLAAVSHTADFMEQAAERRRRERETLHSDIQALREDPYRLTDSEREMIDTIGLRRVHANNDYDPQTPSSTRPMSLHYSASNRHSTDSQNNSWFYTSNLQNRSTASIDEYMRQRNSERSRNSNSYQPRRRSSIVMLNPDSASSPHPSTLAPIGTAVRTLSASPSRLGAGNGPTVSAQDEPWHTITEAMGTNTETLARMRYIDNTAANVRSLERRSQQSQASQRSQLLEQMSATNERQRSVNASHARRLQQLQAAMGRGELGYDELEVGNYPARGRPEDGPTTMGIGWSDNGMNLYVAIEEGIFEYPVNIDERKQFPGLSFL